ncbi:BA75_02314T0 [Komagataella pastoris]|uniref:Vacuolar transporter chaperone complex subunit 4 n=1 Tax=Komagataella pastoris TaxID=4922 RepID=A0A1B2JBU5_PICPA|nr:BA75_02314T0 [Komagataella pastoris]
MKFGETLKSSLIQDYNYYYIQYDELKYKLKKGLQQTQDEWSNDLEEKFVDALEQELDKVYSFVKLKHQEILRRIKDVESLVSATVDGSRNVSSDNERELYEQDFEDLEEELSDVIADVHDLAKFTRLNYIGFQKILKKHDKQTNQSYILKPIFLARLNSKAFYKDNYDSLVVKLSKLYDLVRTRGNPVKGDSSSGGRTQNFVRQTTKYWVHPDNITELKLIILKHLPVLVFNSSKEFEKEDSAITSIYFDDKDMDLYYGRLLKNEGAEAIRLRWYGGMSSDNIFVERKTHREDWTGEKSVKARFSLKEKNVNDFLRGDFTVHDAFDKIRKEGKKSPQEIESLERLANEVQYRVIKDKMRPVMRSFYNRTAFQLPGDARVRISLDTELTLVREDNFDGIDRTQNNWRRMDIGIDYPFNQLPEKDVCRFPYAVLEVKLQTQLGQEPPAWVKEMVGSHLVEAVPKFSKFIHGCATLLPEKVDLIPFWLPQMDIDIRKPRNNQRFGIKHRENLGNENGTGSGNDFDEEESTGIQQLPLANGAFQSPHPASHPYSANHTTTNWIASFKKWYREATALDDSFFKVPSGTVFDVSFSAPPGKKIAVPIRVEPKVYFATERTYLSWLSIAMIIGGTATLLLSYGDKISFIASIGFFITATATILYSMGVYLWRVVNIRKKRAIRYDDQLGPRCIAACLALSIGLSFVFRVMD